MRGTTRIIKVLVLFIFLLGCGGVRETVPPSSTPNVNFVAADNAVELKGITKVAVFPFADYSHQQDFLHREIWGGNIRIVEEVTDHIVAHGISVTVQEDVNTLLMDHNIIKPVANQYLIYDSEGKEDKAKFRTKVMGTPEYDLVNVEHSEDMKKEIINVIRDEMALEKAEKPPIQTPILQGATVGLDREMVRELGEQLGVDLIVRGRIIEYGYKTIDTYNPLKRGFLPVLIEPVKDALFGMAEAKKYENDLDTIDDPQWGSGFRVLNCDETDCSRLGEGAGFLFGQKTEDDVEGTWDVLMEHSFGTIAKLYPRKKSMSTIVQIRMYAQDVKTGDVVWSNRAETEYVPSSGVSFNQKHPKTMFDTTIKTCVKLLMDDLLSSVAPARAQAEGVLAPPEDAKLLRELRDKIASLENSNKILLDQVEGKTMITLPESVLFASGSATLTEAGKKPLRTISEVLERYPGRSICVEGHTDIVPIGPRIIHKFPTNWELSTDRAIEVMNYMVKNFKFEQNRMSVKGYGPYKPVAPNDTNEGRAMNRRVVIVVETMG